MKRKAIIVGHRGQDGRLLERLLRAGGDAVLGVGREGPVDIRDYARVSALVRRFRPDEVYYLASYQHSSSDRLPDADELQRRSWEVNVLGLINFLESLRRYRPKARLFYAASSRVFGDPGVSKVTEKTPLRPKDAYGLSKAAGMIVCDMYRRRHKLFAAVGILFNHDAPGRSPRYVSGKIARAAAAAARGDASPLILGRLSDQIDWSDARDVVEAMRAIIRHACAEDFIVSRGRLHSVREFAAAAYAAAGLNWRRFVRTDKTLVSAPRRAFAGDHGKLTRLTGWKPRTSLQRMAETMVGAERRP